MFEGTHVAIVTPFREGKIDRDGLAGLIGGLLDAGVDGIVPCGTTGESPTLSHQEHEGLIETVVGLVNGRALVIAGTGSNNTAEALRLTSYAARCGADGALIVAPYYNKPTQEGLYRHFAEIASGVSLPIVLYNAPGRCGVEIGVSTIVRLRESFSNIVAVKHATGSVDTASELRCASDITLLSGDDTLTLPLISVGAAGVISVIANLLPGDMSELVRRGRCGEMERAGELHRRLFPLSRAMLSLESNPIPIKAALAMTGKICEELRLPLCPLGDENRRELSRLLCEYGLL